MTMHTAVNKMQAWVKKHGQVSENAFALTFAESHGERWRYCVEDKDWLQWADTHWLRGQNLQMMDAVREFMASLSRGLRLVKLISNAEAIKFQSRRAIAGVEQLCRGLPSFLVPASIFDVDAFYLGTPGGTIDLLTGSMLPAEREDYITVVTSKIPAPPGTPAPQWQAFLDEVTVGDRDLQRTMQQWAGAGASGSTRDQRIMFLYGSGRNGKGVYCRVIAELLGDHVANAPRGLFLQRKHEQHPTELVNVMKSRMVLASEIPEGAAWNETLIKDVTGGDGVAIRGMKENFTKGTRPRCTITMQGNVKPELKTVDDAIRDRFLLVTFPYYVPEEKRVADLEHKLISDEGPAILRWIIDGAVDREISGKLHVARAVTVDTEEYLKEEDDVAEFMAEQIEKCTETDITTADVHETYENFCRSFGRNPKKRATFVTAMKRAGIGYRRSNGVSYFTGIKLKNGF